MKEYHKINSIFKRDLKGKFLMWDFSEPAFEYLQANPWVFTEKVDGTNVRVGWNPEARKVTFGGRTDDAQMPMFLIERLQTLFPAEKFLALYGDCPMVLYGEGYGAKIQKGGGNYKSDGQDFVLFDVNIVGLWLERPNVEDIATKLELKTVPIIHEGPIRDAIAMCQTGFSSVWGSFNAEGVVLRPKTEIQTRRGERIITKVKFKDFR